MDPYHSLCIYFGYIFFLDLVHRWTHEYMSLQHLCMHARFCKSCIRIRTLKEPLFESQFNRTTYICIRTQYAFWDCIDHFQLTYVKIYVYTKHFNDSFKSMFKKLNTAKQQLGSVAWFFGCSYQFFFLNGMEKSFHSSLIYRLDRLLLVLFAYCLY